MRDEITLIDRIVVSRQICHGKARIADTRRLADRHVGLRADTWVTDRHVGLSLRGRFSCLCAASACVKLGAGKTKEAEREAMRMLLTLIYSLAAGILLATAVVLGWWRREPSTAVWLAFVSDRGNGQSLYRMRPDGGEVQRLTSGEGDDFSPAWSPDGRTIAFMSFRGVGSNIFTISADGGNLRQLTSLGNVSTPVWSPDGRWVIFVSRWLHYNNLVQVHPERLTMRALTDGEGVDTTPVWFPGGQEVVFVSNRDVGKQIFRVDVGSRGLERLSDGMGTNTQPALSADGQWLAFVSDRGGNADIYRMKVETGQVERLTASGGDEAQPAWSPDGQWIAYLGNTTGRWELYRMRADGSDGQRLTYSAEIEQVAGLPRWSPDGQWLAFTGVTAGSYTAVYRIKPDGSRLQRLTPAGSNSNSPAWSPVADLPWHGTMIVTISAALFISGVGSQVFFISRDITSQL